MSESSSGQEFDAVERIEAEAIGEPGKRRFRLLTVTGGETRIVWLEKQQLQSLIEALERVLSTASERDIARPAGVVPEFELDTRQQIRAGHMEVGFDEAHDHFVILVHDLENRISTAPAFVCRITRGQARDLIEQSDGVINAGRPICPLCGSPMESGGHVCPVQNGHLPHRLDEVRDLDSDE